MYGEVIESPALNVDRNAIVTVDGEVVDTRVKPVFGFLINQKVVLLQRATRKAATIYSFLPKELKHNKCWPFRL